MVHLPGHLNVPADETIDTGMRAWWRVGQGILRQSSAGKVEVGLVLVGFDISTHWKVALLFL